VTGQGEPATLKAGGVRQRIPALLGGDPHQPDVPARVPSAFPSLAHRVSLAGVRHWAGEKLALTDKKGPPGSVDVGLAPDPLTPSLSPKGARATGHLLRNVKSLLQVGCALTTSPPGERSAEGRVRGGPPRGATKARDFGSTFGHGQGQLFTTPASPSRNDAHGRAKIPRRLGDLGLRSKRCDCGSG
jgi:hypothetical protein